MTTTTVSKNVGGKLASTNVTTHKKRSTTHAVHVPGAPSVLTSTHTSPDYRAAASNVGGGVKQLGSMGGAVIPIMAVSVAVLLLARARGASINVEKALVASFVVALVLTLVGQWNPGLATAFAALVLVEVLLSYGHTALGGIGSAGTSTAAIPQIATSGDLAASAAAAGGPYLGYKLGKDVVSGLTGAAGNAAAKGGASLLSKAASKLKSVLSPKNLATAAEDAAKL